MNLIEAICKRNWAIQPEFLRIILEIAARQRNDNMINALQKRRDAILENSRIVSRRNDVAIIPVYGPIFKFANLFTDVSGATSLQVLMREFHTALENPEITTIILDIDSPGGEVAGVNEFANAVFDARNEKNIISYVGGTGASAAYWIASAASRIIIDETAMVGSIGVVATYWDDREALEREGIREIEIVSSSSPQKRPDLTTEDGRMVIQRRVDTLAEIFVNAVSRNRNVSVETVLKDFGQGDVRIGQDAVNFGMADEIGSLESIIESLTKKEVMKMAEQKQSAQEIVVITTDLIAQEYPDIAAYFRDEGKLQERGRIQEIFALSRPGLQDLIAEAMFHSDDDAGTVALRIIERENARRTAENQLRKEDAFEIPPLNARTEEENEDALQRKIDEAVIKGLNARFEKYPA